MIKPTENDIGRRVTYQRAWLDSFGKPHLKLEDGTITSFNDYCVFVRYGADLHSKGTRREDLEWATPKKT